MATTEIKDIETGIRKEKENVAMCCCIGCGITTTITYIIGMILSWVYTRELFPGNGAGVAAAIIITLPVFTYIGSMICGSIIRCDEVGKCLIGLTQFTICISALLDVIGVILLIVSMVQASKELESPAGPIVGGAFAAFFVAVSAISNCSTICSTFMGSSKE